MEIGCVFASIILTMQFLLFIIMSFKQLTTFTSIQSCLMNWALSQLLKIKIVDEENQMATHCTFATNHWAIQFLFLDPQSKGGQELKKNKPLNTTKAGF